MRGSKHPVKQSLASIMGIVIIIVSIVIIIPRFEIGLELAEICNFWRFL